ncbi:uncharacterized protein LOC108993993 [Juglans regia]|uniref:Uncharacterized protein LOC108993993 n=2 Tax=Juglans regia TaxID=51240 RepID=A0A6P9E8B3_JUGRE|nr:uncharacterized protein LOC108993993 [Juglans regia]
MLRSTSDFSLELKCLLSHVGSSPVCIQKLEHSTPHAALASPSPLVTSKPCALLVNPKQLFTAAPPTMVFFDEPAANQALHRRRFSLQYNTGEIPTYTAEYLPCHTAAAAAVSPCCKRQEPKPLFFLVSLTRYLSISHSLVHRESDEMAAIIGDMADLQQQSQWEFSCDLEVDYESEENASMVYAALAVDKELQPDKVKRQMAASNGKLTVHFEAVEARFLRASFSAFVDVLTLATKTIEEFGQGMEL